MKDNKMAQFDSSLHKIQSIPLDDLIDQIDIENKSRSELSDHEGLTISTAKDIGYGENQYIRFVLDTMLLAIPLSRALEIGLRPSITLLPNLPEWVLGVSNIRGDIISIVDLKIFFGMGTLGSKRESRFIIIRNEEIKVGIIVDRIMGLFSLDRIEGEIQETPFEEGDISPFISGVLPGEDQILHFLDVDKLLSSKRMNAFKSE